MERSSMAKIALLIILWPTLLSSAIARELITQDEANLPEYTLTERDVFPGPKIVVVSPSPDTGLIKSPIHFKLRFSPRGAGVDIGSIKVTYIKKPFVDLTDRVRAFTSASGIDLPDAEVPPGDHKIRIEVTDTGGMPGRLELMLHINKQ
jgi:hypothetical protein